MALSCSRFARAPANPSSPSGQVENNDGHVVKNIYSKQVVAGRSGDRKLISSLSNRFDGVKIAGRKIGRPRKRPKFERWRRC